YANEFFDFSIDENGSLYVNGFQYPLDKEKTLSFKDKNYYYFGLESDFVITPNEDVTTNSKCPWILWIGDVNSGKYGLCVNGVKKTQLTPDNWMDFFEFVLDYQFQKTASGDLQGLCSNVMLKPVDGVDILYVSDGMARVTFNNPQWGFVRLDLVNESAHIDIMTQEEYEKYSYLFASLSFPTDSGVHEFTYNSDEKEYTCLLLSLIEDEMQHEGENLVAIDVLYSIEQDLDSIGGTVYYK
ncbi:MAG: hypothetical protein IKZ95_03710, partial [Lachnospiraceae bacterium]|nr:hypothetical protein [Lachnospiraceae bacterium]